MPCFEHCEVCLDQTGCKRCFKGFHLADNSCKKHGCGKGNTFCHGTLAHQWQNIQFASRLAYTSQRARCHPFPIQNPFFFFKQLQVLLKEYAFLKMMVVFFFNLARPIMVIDHYFSAPRVGNMGHTERQCFFTGNYCALFASRTTGP